MRPDELLITLLKSFVKHPEEISIDVLEGKSINLKLHMHPEDLSMFKEKNLQASLDTILKAAGGKIKKRVDLEVIFL